MNKKKKVAAKRKAKAPKAQDKRAVRSPKKAARTPKRRVKLVQRKASAKHESQINALIARVYQKAAAEMRRVEALAGKATKKLFSDAAKDMHRVEEKFRSRG